MLNLSCLQSIMQPDKVSSCQPTGKQNLIVSGSIQCNLDFPRLGVARHTTFQHVAARWWL